jgi:hypothetical protein
MYQNSAPSEIHITSQNNKKSTFPSVCNLVPGKSHQDTASACCVLATNKPNMAAYEPKAVLVSNYALSSDVAGSPTLLYECQR